MKKIISFVILLLMVLALSMHNVSAQDTIKTFRVYKPFRVNVMGGIGGSFAESRKKEFVGTASIEPRYTLKEFGKDGIDIAVGLKYVYAGWWSEDKSNKLLLHCHTALATITCTDLSSNKLNGNRIYLEIGTGVSAYQITDTLLNATQSNTGFAFMPGIGFEKKRARIEFSYNYNGTTKLNYFCLSMGFYLSGGKIKQ